jgi:hypothetical protein
MHMATLEKITDDYRPQYLTKIPADIMQEELVEMDKSLMPGAEEMAMLRRRDRVINSVKSHMHEYGTLYAGLGLTAAVIVMAYYNR